MPYSIEKLGPSAPIEAPPHSATSRRASTKTSSASRVGSPARIACKRSRATSAQRRSRSASRLLSQSRNLACSSGVNWTIAPWISPVPLRSLILRLTIRRFKRTAASSKGWHGFVFSSLVLVPLSRLVSGRFPEAGNLPESFPLSAPLRRLRKAETGNHGYQVIRPSCSLRCSANLPSARNAS